MYEVRGAVSYEAGMVPWSHKAQELHQADPCASVKRMVEQLFEDMAKNLKATQGHAPKAVTLGFSVIDVGRSVPEAELVEKKKPAKHGKDAPAVAKEGRWDNGKGTD